MSDLRTAAQQALEALEAVDNDEHGKTSFPATVYTAIIKLRAALAQPAASAQPAPARVPLTEQQVFDSQEFMHLNGSLLQLAMPQLMLLVRCIERAHGIAAKEAP